MGFEIGDTILYKKHCGFVQKTEWSTIFRTGYSYYRGFGVRILFVKKEKKHKIRGTYYSVKVIKRVKVILTEKKKDWDSV